MQAAGGALHVLNGNHETMSVGGRYTYVTAGAVQDYERWQRIQQTGAKLRVSHYQAPWALVLRNSICAEDSSLCIDRMRLLGWLTE